MTKILLTGFEPFDEVKVNPSQLIVEHFKQQKIPDLITEVLPVAYDVAGERIKTLLQDHQPDVVILLGVAQKQEQINLERIAVNINDATIPDNNGKHFSGKPIYENAPVAYWSTLPLDDMFTTISKAEIPVKFSNHAGAYLCNHVFYVARHTLEMMGRGSVPCGFIHLPSIETMRIETQIQAIGICLQQFQNPTGFAKLLKQLAEKLPDRPYYTYLQDANEGLIASWGSGKINHDRAVLMAGAFVQLGERILSELQCGDFRYQVVIGTEGTFFGVRLSDNQDVLSMCFNKVKSLDNLIRDLGVQLNEINTALSCIGYDIADELQQIHDKYAKYTPHGKLIQISVEQLMIQPREVAIVTVDGLIISGAPEELRKRIRFEEDRISAMTAAGLSLGERISSEMGNGILEEVIIYGTKGTFILTAVGEEAVLAAVYDRVVSLDRLRSQLQDVANAVAQWV